MPEWPDWWRTWLEGFENEAASGAERLVGGEGFAELLGHLAENAVAVTKISADVWDMALRNLRLAGRSDIDRLARQLAATEDKLESVLQAVEPLQDDLARQLASTEDKLDRLLRAVEPVADDLAPR
jgi:hypothetical protein